MTFFMIKIYHKYLSIEFCHKEIKTNWQHLRDVDIADDVDDDADKQTHPPQQSVMRMTRASESESEIEP